MVENASSFGLLSAKSKYKFGTPFITCCEPLVIRGNIPASGNDFEVWSVAEGNPSSPASNEISRMGLTTICS